MEPSNVSNTPRSSSYAPTPEEVDAQACLPPEAERLQSRAAEAASAAPAPPPPAVQALVDRHASSAPAPLPPESKPPAVAGASPRAAGVALSLGAGAALGAWGVEASVGLLVDLDSGTATLFTSVGGGSALAPTGSAGVAAQASYVDDVQKFWGNGAELGANLPFVASPALGFTEPTPEGPRELNSATVSVGQSAGADVHTYATNTRAHGSYDLDGALQRAAQAGRQLLGQ